MATQNICKLHDNTGTTVYPITHAKAVVGLSEAQQCMTSVTYAKIVDLRDNNQLVPGMMYRITDYTCTTTQEDTQSVGHVFDIIVTAVEPGKVSEIAKAVQHAGDTYFANSNLEAWQLWYDLDNDTTKYLWADATNGKGVIWRMIDEFGNDCPYDFKNIQFKRYWSAGQTIDDNEATAPIGVGYCITKFHTSIPDNTNYKWMFTFSRLVNVLEDYSNINILSTILDESIQTTGFNSNSEGSLNLVAGTHNFNNRCSLNIINAMELMVASGNASRLTKILPNNVFFTTISSINNTSVYCPSYNNRLGAHCYGNTFETSCARNTFENHCYCNFIGAHSDGNMFRNYCHSNILGSSCDGNIFDDGCSSNIFNTECDGNTLKFGCYNNILGTFSAGNLFGMYSQNNKFNSHCYSNKFGNFNKNNTCGTYCYCLHFGENCESNIMGNYSFGNVLGTSCYGNKFGTSSYSNTFGEHCTNNTLANYCALNTFGKGVHHNILNFNYTISCKFDDTVAYINLKPVDGAQGTATKYLNNIHILQGVHGGTRTRSNNYEDFYTYTDTTKLDVAIDTYSQDYEICVGFTQNKTLKIWSTTPED